MRGFAFSLTAALAALILFTTAAAIIAISWLSSGAGSALAAHLFLQKSESAKTFLITTLEEALIDAAYVSIGCTGALNADYCGNASQIWGNYSNSSIAALLPKLNLSALFAFSCAEVAPLLNRTFNISLVATLVLNSSDGLRTFKQAMPLTLSRSIDVNRSNVFVVRLRSDSDIVKQFNVNCSA